VRVLNERATGRYADLNLAQNTSRYLHRADCEPSDLLPDRQSEGGLTDYSHSCTYIVWIQVGANASLIAVIDCELATLV
jgi:hypothetical protein